MHGFRLRALTSIAKRYGDSQWECVVSVYDPMDVTVESQVFAVARGDTKEIATMRAELIAISVNKGTRENVA